MADFITAKVDGAQSQGTPRSRGFDLGILVLRGAAALLLASAGWGKIHALAHVLNSNRTLDSWYFVRIIRQVGFPAPRLMAVCAVLNESLIASLLVLGIVARPAALVASLGMAGALYSSICWHEEPLRAALFALIFAALAFLGAGRYSLTHALWPRPVQPQGWPINCGLLLLRTGTAIAGVTLVAMVNRTWAHQQPLSSPWIWPLVVACIGGLLVGSGLFVRPASAMLSVFWICEMAVGLHAGQIWAVYPSRAALFVIIYGGLALTGPGRLFLLCPAKRICKAPGTVK